MTIQELFSDKQYIFDELIRMREAWGYKSTFNEKTVEASLKVLGFMRLYAPEDVLGLVEASYEELFRRERFMLFGSFGPGGFECVRKPLF